MSTKKTDPESQISSSSLQNKPQRERRRSFAWVFYLLGGLVLLGGILLILWQVLPSSSRGNTGTATTTVPNKNRPIDFPPASQGDRPIFWQSVKNEAARQLHLSVTDLHSRLSTPKSADTSVMPTPTPQDTSSSSGKSGSPTSKGNTRSDTYTLFTDLATQQGISNSQLSSVEVAIVQSGFDQLVTQNIVSRSYADDWIQRVRGWTQDTFNKFITLAFDRH